MSEGAQGPSPTVMAFIQKQFPEGFQQLIKELPKESSEHVKRAVQDWNKLTQPEISPLTKAIIEDDREMFKKWVEGMDIEVSFWQEISGWNLTLNNIKSRQKLVISSGSVSLHQFSEFAS